MILSLAHSYPNTLVYTSSLLQNLAGGIHSKYQAAKEMRAWGSSIRKAASLNTIPAHPAHNVHPCHGNSDNKCFPSYLILLPPAGWLASAASVASDVAAE